MRRNIFYWISLIRLLIAAYILLLMLLLLLGYQAYGQAQNRNTHISTASSYIMIFLLLVLAFATANAIREIKNVKKVMAQTGDNYRRFVQNTGEIIIRSDGYGKILFVNRAFKEKLGYSDDEISKLNITDLFAEGTRSAYGGNSISFRQDEQITTINVIYKTKSGRKIYLDGNVVLNYKDGRLETTESFLRDTTQRTELHDELLASENKYRALFDLSPLPEYFVDTGTLQFVEVNPAAVKKYGFSRTEFLKMTIYDLRRLEGEEKLRFHSWFTSFTKGDVAYEGKTTHYKRNGQPIDVELRLKPIELANRKMLLVIAIDVTKKEKREREINQAILKAQENERHEIGTELHDNICQVLASSQLLLDLAKRSGNVETNKLIDRGKKNITLALNEIRNLSHRLAPIFLEMSSFEGAVSDLLLNMNPGDRHEIDFEFDQKITSGLVSSDIQLNLYRILQEQLKNIVKYANASVVKVGLSLESHVIRMYIIDNGVGFDPAKVKKGIGLVNIQRRAELFGGKFSVDTSPGKGCRLFIELPVLTNDLNKP
jgi:PAS domain S-box-containing protein